MEGKMNLLESLLVMSQVYDYFNMDVPVAIIDTSSWALIGQPYNSDGTLSREGILIDVERAIEHSAPGLVLAHELAHIEQIMKADENGIKEADTDEEEANIIAIEIFNAAMELNSSPD